jgi:hypothetical protein
MLRQDQIKELFDLQTGHSHDALLSETEGMQECDFAKTAVIDTGFRSGRFGHVNLIRMEIGCTWKIFAAKFSEWQDGCEELGNTFVGVLNLFSHVDHACVEKVLYYQKPARGRGPTIAPAYSEGGSLHALLNGVRGGKERVDVWTPTARVIIICGIVQG